MKLLLDENLPVKLKYRFTEIGLEVYTLRDMHWLGKENGVLLNLMKAENFTGFVTIDNNLAFQNNFTDYSIAVIILVAHDNTYETIMEFFDIIVSGITQNLQGIKTIIHPNYKASDL